MLFRTIVISLCLLAGSLMAGCATFPPEEGRVSEINKNASDYADQAILLNLIRAERFEPLSFVTVTGLDGTNSVQGSLGFAGFNLGPHPSSSPRSFLLGPDAVSRTGSNTFHVSVVDDPVSFVALMSPVTPATIAFFINQGYPRELLFFLFVDHLRKTTPARDGRTQPTVEDFRNDPSDSARFGQFIGVLASLLRDGLTAEVDVTAAPSGRSLPKSALCFDGSLPPPAFAGDARPLASTAPCADAVWVEADQGGGGAASGGGGAKSGGGAPTMFAGSDGSLWVFLSDENEIRHLVPGKPVEDYDLPKPRKTSAQAPLTSFPLKAADGTIYDVYVRSAYSVYAYLGALRRGNGAAATDITNLMPPDAARYGGILNITGDKTGCFVSVDYNGHYCVPSGAGNTKRIFSLLHQLQEINTAPSNAPTTLTVTSVP